MKSIGSIGEKILQAELRYGSPSKPTSRRLTVVSGQLIESGYKVNFINFVESLFCLWKSWAFVGWYAHGLYLEIIKRALVITVRGRKHVLWSGFTIAAEENPKQWIYLQNSRDEVWTNHKSIRLQNNLLVQPCNLISEQANEMAEAAIRAPAVAMEYSQRQRIFIDWIIIVTLQIRKLDG